MIAHCILIGSVTDRREEVEGGGEKRGMKEEKEKEKGKRRMRIKAKQLFIWDEEREERKRNIHFSH